jgi:hypothetical protein
VVPSSIQSLGIHRMGAEVEQRRDRVDRRFPLIETCTVPEDTVEQLQYHLYRNSVRIYATDTVTQSGITAKLRSN